MVCVPCFIAPVLLFIWYKFIYPLLRPILERYFGDRFALPRNQDPDYCPICPLNSKGKCENQDNSKDKCENQDNSSASTDNQINVDENSKKEN